MGGGGDTIYGDSSSAFRNFDKTGTIQGGNDILNGDDGNDALYGDFFTSRTFYGMSNVSTEGGNDTLNGGAGDDTVYGDGDLAQITNGGGNLINDGNDVLAGGDGNDILVGDHRLARSYVNTSVIQAGNDTIDGGAGNDDLWGDFQTIEEANGGVVLRGSDTFKFSSGVAWTPFMISRLAAI